MSDRSERTSKITLAAECRGEVVSESLELEAQEFPRLVELLSGPDREDIHDELCLLLRRYWRPRSTRWRLNVLSRLLFIGADGIMQQEPAIVEDISRSGVRLAIKRSTRLELMALAAARVQLLGEGEDELFLDLPSWFVRVAAVDDDSVSLAFHFATIDDDQLQALEVVIERFRVSERRV